MLDSTNVKPAFGQMWTYSGDISFMLIAKATKEGEWIVGWIYSRGMVIGERAMCGLRDDPASRLPKYKLLSEAES